MTEFLEGSLVVPFPLVAGAVGLIFCATLIYFVRRPKDDD